MKSYIEKKVIYTNDGRLIDEDGKSIMMDWEKPIMEFQAKQIAQNGGDILNVGYGMGFIDFEIEKYNPRTHHIIEIHPQVQDKMMEDGWYKKSHVKMYFGDWKVFLDRLPKLDGIYFDTWEEDFTAKFVESCVDLLKPNGILTFFNNPKDDYNSDNIPDHLKPLIEKYFDVEITSMEIPFIDNPIRQTGDEDSMYWSPYWKIYYSPLLKLRNTT